MELPGAHLVKLETRKELEFVAYKIVDLLRDKDMHHSEGLGRLRELWWTGGWMSANGGYQWQDGTGKNFDGIRIIVSPIEKVRSFMR